MEYIEILEMLLSQKMGKSCEINQTTTFEELGLDSFEVVDFALILENHFGITFFDEELHDLKSIQELIESIKSHTNLGGQLC